MDEPDPDQLLTALTTEHFTLQGARSSTTTEASARTALYLAAVSSTLIGLGFTGRDTTLFRVFALTVLPTVAFLGVVTFLRLVELGAEDFLYGRAINRIRSHYRELAGPRAELFLLEGHDDNIGVMRNMGLRSARWSQLLLTFATAIAVVNSVVVGAAAGILTGTLGAVLGAAVGVGAAVMLASLVLHVRVQLRGQGAVEDIGGTLHPSDAGLRDKR